MIRRPPRSTRTDTLFPYPTLFRSLRAGNDRASTLSGGTGVGGANGNCQSASVAATTHRDRRPDVAAVQHSALPEQISLLLCFHPTAGNGWHGFGDTTDFGPHFGENAFYRSEESRVGNESVSTCRSRLSP